AYWRAKTTYDHIGRVKKAQIDNFEIEFEIFFQRSPEGFWQIRFVNENRPLHLTMMNNPSYVHIEFEGEPRKDPPLSKAVISKIEKVLSDTLTSCFKSSFFPDDFGHRFPVELPEYEWTEKDKRSPEIP